MSLDPVTLGVAYLTLTGVLGLLLLFSWLLNRSVQALAWWGMAFCLVPFGMGLVSLGLTRTDTFILFTSNGLMAVVYGILYSGCRAFNGRSPTVPAILSGLAVWVLAFPVIYESFEARLIVASGISGAYAFLSGWELWRHARQKLVSRQVAIVLLGLMVAFHAFRSGLVLHRTDSEWVNALTMRWSANMGLFLLLFTPALAFVFLSMAKEQVEYGHKQAALSDPLTGIPNRRAVFRNAAELLRRLEGRPATCLLFDLDNFKRINDSHGHEVGDHILTLFGQVLAAHLPEGAFGRMGGEEFVAVLPLPRHRAEGLADEIRRAFAEAARTVLGHQVAATVSIGCATGTNATVEALIREADRALYQAKASGRNAVVMAQRAAE
ncbi:GGDEF domain-containing protein [Microvirga thermotolerans]|uniref:diguanylate cyclase n=1 Tax=Microvirga thermotolerans TaxID=2651334 RepID=A0A5P9JV42_9HYPH|nr:GGDEF domain-containing protein [Microvirga thermotolerans]QFU15648.1 diguanylate cyclase [Microvirga thermotolerans]